MKHVNGLLNLGVSAFGWFNLALGSALFTLKATTNDFFLITSTFTYQFWGVTFAMLGLTLLIGQFFNRWALMRTTLVALLSLKFIWLSALVGRQVDNPDANIFLLLFFALVTVLQMGIYIYFPVYKKIETWKR